MEASGQPHAPATLLCGNEPHSTNWMVVWGLSHGRSSVNEWLSHTLVARASMATCLRFLCYVRCLGEKTAVGALKKQRELVKICLENSILFKMVKYGVNYMERYAHSWLFGPLTFPWLPLSLKLPLILELPWLQMLLAMLMRRRQNASFCGHSLCCRNEGRQCSSAWTL